MQRLLIHIIHSCGLNALRTLSAQRVLQHVHADCVQVPNLQEECSQYGSTMAQADAGDREPADARAVLEYPCYHPMQRLLSQVLGQVSLAGKSVCHM